MAEDFGIEGRGRFYDEVGTLRDVVQNHLLQIVALLAMEPPVSDDADAMADEVVKVFRSMRPLRPRPRCGGASTGATSTRKGWSPDSDTETYVSLECEINSWRWAGVPWRIRAGKALDRTCTEAVVEFSCNRPGPCSPTPTAPRSRTGCGSR